MVSLIANNKAIQIHTIDVSSYKPGNCTVCRLRSFLEATQTVFKEKIKWVMGDREFGAFSKILIYQSFAMPFVVRIKEQWRFATKDSLSVSGLLHENFQNLSGSESLTLHNVRLGQKSEVCCSISAKKLNNGELLIVDHSEGVTNPIASYKERWWIERLFFHSKNKGVRLEATGLRKPKKLVALIIIMAIATAIRPLKTPSVKRKSHSYPAESLFKRGIDALIAKRSACLCPQLNFVRQYRDFRGRLLSFC